MIQISVVLLVVAGIFLAVLGGLVALAIVKYGSLWLQAYCSGADVSALSLIGMSLRRVNPSKVVMAEVMSRQAGIEIDTDGGKGTARLEAHVLAGGDLMQVLQAIIAAHRAGMDLSFDKAAAIDLAGRDVWDAVRTSVSPRVTELGGTLTSTAEKRTWATREAKTKTNAKNRSKLSAARRRSEN